MEGEMVSILFSKSRRVFIASMMMWTIILVSFTGVLAADDKKPQAEPLRT